MVLSCAKCNEIFNDRFHFIKTEITNKKLDLLMQQKLHSMVPS